MFLHNIFNNCNELKNYLFKKTITKLKTPEMTLKEFKHNCNHKQIHLKAKSFYLFLNFTVFLFNYSYPIRVEESEDGCRIGERAGRAGRCQATGRQEARRGGKQRADEASVPIGQRLLGGGVDPAEGAEGDRFRQVPRR